MELVRRLPMAFIANEKELRTIDSERDLELVTAGGGPGYSNFILRAGGSQVFFSGHPVSRPVEGVDSSLPAAISKVLIWKVFNQFEPLPGRSRDESRELITEALTAFKGVHGYPAGQAVEVDFNPHSSELNF